MPRTGRETGRRARSWWRVDWFDPALGLVAVLAFESLLVAVRNGSRLVALPGALVVFVMALVARRLREPLRPRPSRPRPVGLSLIVLLLGICGLTLGLVAAFDFALEPSLEAHVGLRAVFVEMSAAERLRDVQARHFPGLVMQGLAGTALMAAAGWCGKQA